MIRRATAVKTMPDPEGVHVHVDVYDGSQENARPASKRESRKRKGPLESRKSLQKYFLVAFLALAIFLGFSSVLAGINAIATKRNNLRSNYSDANNIIQLQHANDDDFQKYTLGAPSCDQITADQVSFTLVTQFSADRLWMMEYHCQRWGSTSPISVAVLANVTTAETRKNILKLGCDPNQLSVQTLDTNAALDVDYPVNILRRMALSAVKTSHVMYVDIDFWEAIDLHELLHLKEVKDSLSLDPKQAIVVPAFQLNRQCREYRDCPEDNIPRMPRNRKDMLNTLMERKGYPFDPTNRGGHGSTMYEQWIQQQPGDLLDIPCIQSNRYEPYLAFRYCHDLPPFQIQFSGYGKNKMTWVMQMRREGYIFSQLGGAFVVHYPHLDSTSRMEWNRGPKEVQPYKGGDGKMYKKRPRDAKVADWTAFKRGRVDAAFVDFRHWLQSELKDQARVFMCHTNEDDDARLWVDRPETEVSEAVT